MNVLLTGIDGYTGWPCALRLSKEFPEGQIVGVDHGGRRKWVEECGAVSAIPIESMKTRLLVARDHGYKNLIFREGDLTDYSFVKGLIEEFRPEVVIHLAAQPSAPYAGIDAAHAAYTSHNNNQATLNLLWALKETKRIDPTHFIETTTTGTYGAPEFEIPEGFLEISQKDGKDTLPFPGLGGSWYHITKCNDANYLWLANKQWKLSISDLRMSIVYGTETEETTRDPRLATRFDFDFWFGVVCNRFCAMAVAGYPLTVYGKGLQFKPMISLEDTVQSIVNCAKQKGNQKFEVYNQTTGPESIANLAEAVLAAAKELNFNVEVRHIPNPRVEKEEHRMKIANKKFMNLLGTQRQDLRTGIAKTLADILPYKETILKYQNSFISADEKKKVHAGVSS